ncbi:Ldh family oxidoreductase [Lampropedia puyangensis]|uniref:Ldh family oxidoreductase n=1 Tax=Lampropedia puyangensis TaxID=1330072 RepID=A0A4S8ERS6_9BURK|nr:Ldh family oxidoreductase [Lampropedia puyangensis]THT97579.1 Ldh family oxidoreductase [Lampropedia puyangensis]
MSASFKEALRVPCEALRQLVASCFEQAGLAPQAAQVVANSLVDSDLRGTHSHGVIRLPFLIARLRDGGAKAQAEIQLLKDAPASALLDGDAALGAVAATQAMQLAISKAKTQGVALVAVNNSDFIGACAHYAMMGLAHNMVTLTWTNGFPGMAPWGGRSNTIGNNPIAFAAPSGRHGPIVLDMALSVAAGGKVRLAAKKGEAIPAGWVVTQSGHDTTDPQELTTGGALLPLGYKGYGLAVFGEILCGALTGSRILSEIPAWFKETSQNIGNGHIHLAIDISRLVDVAVFKERVDTIVDMLKATPLVPGVPEILVPGERAWKTQQQQRQEGIRLPASVVADLRALAASLQVPWPDVVPA